ncbi:MAG: FG-GAP-like repeat-containing protein [Bacteroidota bacterium]
MKKLFTFQLLRVFIFTLILMRCANMASALNANRGNALNFDGTNDYVTIAPGVGIVPTTGDYSISFWAKHNVSQSGNYFELFSQGNNLYFGGNPSGGIRVGDSWSSTSATFPTDGAWHHYGLTKSGSNGYLYIDGTVAAFKFGGFASPSATTFLMGAQFGSWGEYFNGELDEFSVWNRTLSSNEMLSLKNSELAGNESGLVAYYKFNQGAAGGSNTSITTLNDVKELHNGTLTNFALTSSSSNFVTSGAIAPQNALDFDGVDDYVTINNGTGLIPTSGDFSVAFWAKHNAIQSSWYVELFAQGSGKYFGITPSGVIRVGGWGANDVTGINYPMDGAWHHFCLIKSGTHGYLYIDGSQVASSIGITNPSASTFIIGTQYGGYSEYFNGRFDEFSVWNRALGNTEIGLIKSNELTGSETGLIAYYNFNQGINGGDNSINANLIDIKGSNNGLLNNFAKSGTSSNFVSSGFAPVPKITNITPASGAVGTVVTITGENFSVIPAYNVVYFGAVKASVSASTSTSITLSVPAGAGSIVPVSVETGGKIGLSITSSTPFFTVTNNPNISPLYVKSDYGTNNGPNSIAVGDVNNDGKPDIICSNRNSVNINVFLGNGDGTFSSTNSFSSGIYPYAIALADFNGDGNNDIVLISSNQHIKVFLGNGAGSFTQSLDVTESILPYTICVGDFNGDGKMDIATANSDANNISVLLGDRAGGFASPLNYAVGTSPNSIVTCDFNGDGKADIATGNSSGTVSVLLGDGSGGFSTATNFSTSGQPNGIALGDVNGDGKMDIIVANLGSNNLNILPGTGTGSFGIININIGVPQWTLAAGDFNGDGKVDIITFTTDNLVKFLQGNGIGVFSIAATYTVGISPSKIATGDFNMDGRADILVSNYISNTISILKNILQPPVGGTASSNSPICSGSTASLTLTGYTGVIQWQQSADGSTNWTNVSGGSGATTANYTSAALNTGLYYRAQVSQQGYASVFSNVIQVTFFGNLSITSQNAPGATVFGNNAFSPISVAAVNAFGYQWYSNTIASTSNGISLGSANGAQTNTYTPQTAISGTAYYYCIVQGCPQSLTSDISGAYIYYSCELPSNISVSNITPTSAQINWQSSTAPAWSIVCHSLGPNAPYYFKIIDNISSSPYLLEDLFPGVVYTFNIQAVCGGSSSIWKGPYDFTTNCNPITTPFIEDFEGSSFPPECWSTQAVSGSDNWNKFNNASAYGVGSSSVSANFFSESSLNSYDLITRPFNLSTFQIPKLRFDYAYGAIDYSNESLNIYYSTDFGQTWTLMQSMTGGLFGTLQTTGFTPYPFTPSNNEWITNNASIPSTANMIKFEAVGGWNGNNLYLDNIGVIDAAPLTGGTATSNSPVCSGSTASLTLTGYTGNIQWQQSVDSVTWYNVSGGSGATTANYTTLALDSNLYFRAQLTRVGNDTVYSNLVKVQINRSNLSISSQNMPLQEAFLNHPFNSISVVAVNALGYQWYSNTIASNSGGTSLSAAYGAQTNTYTPQSDTLGTKYYYCVVQGVCGQNTKSDVSGAYITFDCNPITTPWSEGFEGNTFPPGCWSNQAITGNDYWIKDNSNSAFGTGTSSIRTNFYYEYNNESYDLITRAFNLNSFQVPKLKFDYAYAYLGYGFVDYLNIYTSSDYGQSWALLQSMNGESGGSLVTAGQSNVDFIPVPNDWATIKIPIPSTTNMIKFEAVSGYGNNLWLDNIGVIDDTPTVKSVKLHLFLEGLFDANTDSTMVEAQDIDWNTGLTFAKYGTGIVDKIQVDLYEQNPPYNYVVGYTDINLTTNGLASFQVPTNINGNYYLKISTRNHLAVWSAIAVPFNTATINYDFTTLAANAYQAPGGNDPQIQIATGVFAFFLGDLDQSFSVDFDDFNLFEPYLNGGTYGFTIADFNGNGLVDFDDFNLFEPRLNQGPFTQYTGMKKK